MRKWLVPVVLSFAIVLSIFLTLYKGVSTPPGFNSDEAAFGYNAYSILQTGKDEYGTPAPLRFKSFGEYKMPLYGYLSVPFIATLGLNETGTRALNVVLAALFPLLIYFFAKEVFSRKEIALVSALLASSTLGFAITSRHAHEAFLGIFLLTLSGYFFLKFIKQQKGSFAAAFLVSLILALFAYQAARVYAVFFLLFTICSYFVQKKTNPQRLLLALLVLVLGLFAITDIIYKPNRVENLLLFNSEGFSMRIDELRREGGNALLYNKLTVGGLEVLNKYLSYFSPEFLAIDGDSNKRFGFMGMSPITPLLYLFAFLGLYYLFKNKEPHRFFLVSLALIAPLTGALSWAETSLTRALFLLVPLTLLSAYGIYQFILLFKKQRIYPYIVGILIFAQVMLLYYSWDFYLNHYPKRPIVSQAWQYGYKDLANFIKENYDTYDRFYVTKKNGQPYIFMLFYLSYPPEKYQKQASLTPLDEFGFGQVEKFDKFDFNFPAVTLEEKKTAYIGFPDDFSEIRNFDPKKVKKISHNNVEIFWIYTND